MFYFEKINGKNILKSDFLKDTDAFFTTRETFIKTKAPELMNLTEQNKKHICKYLNISENKLISPVQTHSANIEIVQENKTLYPDTDGLILPRKDFAIFLNFADCTPVILYDKLQNIGAICHAGWRGTVQKISALTAEKLISNFNSKPQNIIAVIGPAISMCCYNVGEEVFEKLKSSVKDFNNLYRKENNNLYVDLKNINRRQLEEIGVTNIDVCPFCTCCDNNYFFSYRKENGTTNRHSAVLKLK